MELNKPLVIGSTQKHSAKMIDQSTALTEAMGKGGGHVPMSVIQKLTNTPSKFTKNTLDTKTMEMQQNLLQETSPTLTSWLEDSLAKLSVLLENEKDLTTPEALYSLKSLGFLPTKDQDILCLRMLAKTSEFPRIGKECSLSDNEEILDKYLYFL